MKLFVAVVLAVTVFGASAFQSSSLPSSSVTSTSLFEYVPDGFTAESYKKFKAAEAKKKQRNLGALGPKGFQSRSMQSFQEALEKGEATHLMPMFNAKEKLKSGKIRPEDIPYMQRGGKWDNTDVKGARNQKKWLASDKQYAAGGYKKEQSVSIFGVGGGLDWTGKQGRTGPSETVRGAAPKFSRNYKPPNVKDMKSEPKKKKGLFGW